MQIIHNSLSVDFVEMANGNLWTN